MFKSIKLASLTLIILVAGIGCTKDDVKLNQTPKADAGPSKVVNLPGTVTLTGSGTDSDGTIVGYAWTQVSGPEASIIVNPGSASTVVKGFIAGDYIFQLQVIDNGGLTGVDTVAVKVNAPVAQTLTSQPANNPNERMLVTIGGVDYSGTNSELVIDAWTVSGSPYFGRAAIKFDLSSIPSTATITSANLFLYSNTPPENGNLVDANFGTNNSLWLQRITGPWTPATTNWSNQPTVTTTDQISIPSTTQSSLDLNIDVKTLVSSMVNTNTNYGFMLKLQNEVTYTSRMFVASYHATKADKRPKLVVTYTN